MDTRDLVGSPASPVKQRSTSRALDTRAPGRALFVRLARIALLVLALVALMPNATPAQASLIGFITVNTLADNANASDSVCTLRNAITNANFQSQATGKGCAAGGTALTNITFSVSGQIVLTAGGPLLIGNPAGSNVTIDGGNAITVSGGDITRIFTVSGANLFLKDITLTNGNGFGSYGGAVYVNNATLNLDHTTIQNSHTNNFAGSAIVAFGGTVSLLNGSVVQNNYGADYAAINSTGAVNVLDSLVRNNSATTGGGALSVSGPVLISNSLIISNSAPSGGAIFTSGPLTLTQSSVLSNTATAGDGGAIRVESPGQVTTRNSTFQYNQAQYGGAIFVKAGTRLSMSGGSLSYNNVTNSGGGLYNLGTATLNNVTLSGNQALFGGGIVNAATATLINSTVFSNHATSSQDSGGGIFNQDPGTITLTNSTVSFNTSEDTGGGMGNNGTMILTNSTVSNNSAGGDAAGGIDNFHLLYLYNTTVAANDAASDHAGGIAGGINNRNANGAQTLVQNSLMVANFASRDLADCAGTITVPTDFSLFQAVPAGDCTITTGGVGHYSLITRPAIDNLADNGGPTLTHALVPGSEAINKGERGCQDQFGVVLTTDQRGAARVGTCDLGSFEFGGILPRLWLPLIRR